MRIGARYGVVLFALMLAVPLGAVDDAYYDYYTDSQIHSDWIDLNDSGTKEPYEDTALGIGVRLDDLISRMTLEEKTSQLNELTPEIKRLGLPPYRWGIGGPGEALHGLVVRDATVFPGVIGLAATGDVELIEEIYTAVSDEVRANFHRTGIGFRGVATLNFHSPPVLDPVRDGRWQRCEETFGEDPYLAARMGVATISAFQGQGDDAGYRKAVACAKHFPSNRGPLGRDHRYADLKGPASERITREVTFVPYEAAVREADVGAIMCSYSAGRPSGSDWDGTPSCYSKRLLTDILRGEWGFDGYVTSDCGALARPLARGLVAGGYEALTAGCDLNCNYGGGVFGTGGLVEAVRTGTISEADVDRALYRTLRSRFRVGLFDPPSMVPYASTPVDVMACEEHTELAHRAALESIVLLKNDGDLLPLDEWASPIAVIGPAADVASAMYGGYSGRPPHAITPLEGIREAVGEGADVRVVPEDVWGERRNFHGVRLPTVNDAVIEHGRRIARDAEVAVVIVGPPAEGEGATRNDLLPPAGHLRLLKAVAEEGTPTIAVLMNGSPIASNWMKDNVPAIIETWYPGMEGGRAIGDVIFGEYNPSGRLPITIPREGQEPLYYGHKGEIEYSDKTYLWPFGYGLSYTEFEYSDLRIEPRRSSSGEATVSVDIENVGGRSGDEIAQLYVKDVEASVEVPVRQLRGFERISLEPGEKKTVSFEIRPEHLSLLDAGFNRVVEPGEFRMFIGDRPEHVSFEVTERIELAQGPRLMSGQPEVSADVVRADEPVTVAARLKNVGDLTACEEVSLMIDGQAAAAKRAIIGPGDRQELRFTVRLYRPGRRTASVLDSAAVPIEVKPIPAALACGDLRAPKIARTGEAVKISATVTNRGSYAGRKTVGLYVDGEQVAKRSVRVAPAPDGGSRAVTFAWRFDHAGPHNVAIGDLEPVRVNVGMAAPAAFADVSGAGNDARVEGDPLWINGKSGMALAFGSGDDCLIVPDSESLRPEEGVSAAAWAKVNAPTVPDHNPILCKGEYIAGWHYLFRIGVREDGTMTWGVSAGSGEVWWDGGEAKLGEWAHYMVTYDGSTGRSYINGEQVGERSGGGLPLLTAEGHGIRSGSIKQRPSRPAKTVLDGAVDEIRMYNRALSAEEVKRVCNGDEVDEGLVLHLALDEAMN